MNNKYKNHIDNWREYTNYPDFWLHNKLYEKSCSLWVMYHQPSDDISVVYDIDGNPSANHDDEIIVEDDTRISLDEIKQSSGWVDSKYIIIVDQEGLCVDWTKHHPNIYVIDSSFPSNDDRFISFFWWFWLVYQVYDNNNNNNIIDHDKKDTFTMFDSLLGHKRKHRDFVYNKIYENNIRKYFILNYENAIFDKRDNKHWHSCDLPLHSYKDDNPNFLANISCFLPTDIYNKSFYSIITETRYDEYFLTEKTAKPLLSLRLFIFFGKQYTLRNLRKIGYRTFGDVIDESYDDVEDDYTRWKLAFDQVLYLLKQNPHIIYKKIDSIVQHNKQHFISTYNTTSIETLVMCVLDK